MLGIQETMVSSIDSWVIKSFWGRNELEFEAIDAVGKSRGILTIWDPSLFSKSASYSGEGFLAIWGKWSDVEKCCGFINVYAPQDLSAKKRLWSNIIQLLQSNPVVIWVVFGDFNEVRTESERKGTEFSFSGAMAFNNFIHNGDLVDIKSGGRRFSRYSKDGSKLSKLDRFLVSSNLLTVWPNPNVTILPRGFSDHCPILFNSDIVDFGPSYFKFFNAWLEDKSF
ncbi:hypothetical protein OSB04_012087 [Centaurea solstitialis]|uniref:Endonuclease/exonuclease/phosphatase domain-containing protein n=1 Tax=Centaurea solstitialis TaxID=347529 RepID=A0AA38TAR9_9ASTR|nr:hypothetical protein OSB04_012087 [Centaurea solstitialis]